jgi:polysaccharide biosynthesis transport protein
MAPRSYPQQVSIESTNPSESMTRISENIGAEPGYQYYLWIIQRKCWWIIGFVIIALAATYGVSSLITPMYEATTTVDIDIRNPTGVVGMESRQVSALDGDQFMATQMKLIQSDSVLRPVVSQYNLLHVEKQDRQDLALSPDILKKAPTILRKLRLNRPPNTFLVQISYRSPDRELSANVANAIAKSYVQHTYDLRYQTAEGITVFMERQLEELKAKMEKSSDRLAAFGKDLNVADPEQKTAILSSRLIQLNNDYASAQADRLRKEAAFNAVKSGSIEAAEVSTQGDSLRKITERLHEAQERFSLAKSHYAENHPEYKKAALEVQSIQGELDRTSESIGRRVEVEFHQAENRESMVGAAVGELKKEFDGLNSRSFAYQSLKRDAEADKKLYDELEMKIKEAGINAGFQNSSVRVADSARPALRPVSPDLKLNLLLAFCLSTFAAVLMAILMDQRSVTLRDPELDWNSEFNVPILGNLPLVKQNMEAFSSAVSPAVLAQKSLPLTRFMYEEAVHSLRSTILLTPELLNLRSLVVTSALPGEGKTLTACHLAVANARRHKRTLLIDCDFRRPSVSRQCNIHPVRGMESVLDGSAKWRELIRSLPDLPHLDVLAIGINGAHASNLLATKLPSILAEFSAEYDLVVIDSPPLLGLSDTIEIAAAADAVLLLAIPGETNSRLLGHCVSVLRQVGVRNLGLVMNKITMRNSRYSYQNKYGQYYGRYMLNKIA